MNWPGAFSSPQNPHPLPRLAVAPVTAKRPFLAAQHVVNFRIGELMFNSVLDYPWWVLIPAPALPGFAEAGRAVAVLAQNPDWVAAVKQTAAVPLPEQEARLLDIRNALWASMLLLIALTLFARKVRWFILSHKGIIAITYPNGQRVAVLPGTSILEASRQAGIARMRRYAAGADAVRPAACSWWVRQTC